MKRWHLKSSYVTDDDKGKNPVQGSLEAFWAGPNKLTRIYRISGFAQTEYGGTDGIYHSSSPGTLPYPEEIIVEQLLHPLPNQTEVDELTLEKRGTHILEISDRRA